MAWEKGIYILMLKLNEFIFFFASRYFLKEIENMFSVFLSSYRNTWHTGILVAHFFFIYYYLIIDSILLDFFSLKLCFSFCDPICDPIRDPVRSYPGFVDADKKTYNFSFLFQNLSQLLESRPLPTLANSQKAIWRNLLSIQNEAISLVVMHNNEMEWKLTAKAELNCEIYKC